MQSTRSRAIVLLLLLAAGPAAVRADPAPASGPASAMPQGVVNLSASASVDVARDLLSITFSTTREGSDAAAVQSQLKQALDAALAEARKAALAIAEALGHVGVLTVEFFASAEGPVVNEIAPRVHNSGHWTIEGAVTSQFEQHVRAICGLPPGSTARVSGGAVMDNLIGDDVDRWPELVAEEGAHLHIYGKGEARPGRKMGHVTRVTR